MDLHQQDEYYFQDFRFGLDSFSPSFKTNATTPSTSEEDSSSEEDSMVEEEVVQNVKIILEQILLINTLRNHT